ncbi:MAG: ASCH domain-containing protein [Eubacteriales bacterium]|nr:ASCH domain-containing protein [Eubacteriales bacterium]
MRCDTSVEDYFRAFLLDTGRPEDLPLYSSFFFGLDEFVAQPLLQLVLAGKKRATASSLFAFLIQQEALPRPGDLSVITDFAGRPHCVIQTTRVTILPFSAMTYDICRREGEDDTLESWQRGHVRFFTAEGDQLGYAFHWDMPVVFEDFDLIWPQP